MPRRAKKRFDGNAWYEQYIVARTTAALKEKEKSFSDLHAGDSEQELIQYVRRCADEMGYTPTVNLYRAAVRRMACGIEESGACGGPCVSRPDETLYLHEGA